MDQDFLNNDIYKHLKDKGNSKLVSIIETTYECCLKCSYKKSLLFLFLKKNSNIDNLICS